MYTQIETATFCDCTYYADVLKDECDNICFAVEVTIEGTQKVFLVYTDELVEFFAYGVNYDWMKGHSTKTFETYEQFCKWCSYNLKS